MTSVLKFPISFVNKRPIASFIVSMLTLLSIIVVGSKLREPTADLAPVTKAQKINLLSLTETPTLTLQAKVISGNTSNIIAASGGVVTSVLKEGTYVKSGEAILEIGSSTGDSPAVLSRRIAELTYENQLKTFDSQLEVIRLQKEIAEKGDDNADEIKELTQNSNSETEDLIKLNEEILLSLESAEQSLQIKQSIALQKSGLLQLKSQLELNKLTDPAEISDRSTEAAVKGLNIQEEALRLGLEISKLQLDLARAAESASRPSSVIAGRISSVKVSVGDNVAPGTLVAVVENAQRTAALEVFVPSEITEKLEDSEARVKVGGLTFNLEVENVSGLPTRGNLHTVSLASRSALGVPTGTFLEVELQIVSHTTVFLPLEAVHQSQSTTTAFVLEGLKAKEKSIETGTIVGNLIEVKSGLAKKDHVIIGRDIIDGQRVRT